MKKIRNWILVAAVVMVFPATGFVHAQSDTNPPTIPKTVTATFVQPNQVSLSWTASTDDTAVAGYYIYRNGGFVANTAGTSFTDIIAPGVYSYTVAAYDTSGNTSGQSTPSSLISFVADTTPPTAPTSFAAAIASSSSISLSWGASTDNVGVVGYNLYRDGYKLNTGTSLTGTSYTDSSSLVPGYTYNYSISAYDAAGNISPSVGLSFAFDITPPTIPLNLAAVNAGADYIGLAWQSSSDNVGVAGYHVYRNGSLVASVSSTSYLDTGLASGTAYSYAVDAYDGAGNVSTQNMATGTTLAVAPPIFAPPPTSTSYFSGLPPIVSSSPASSVPATLPSSGMVLAGPLYIGLRSSLVSSLQSLLVKAGYLAPQYATGYFGALTQKAVQSFQCKQGIVCSGAPLTTGWGSVGQRTRKALANL